LGPAQLIILHFQFDLVDLQFVHQSLGVFCGQVPQVSAASPEHFFGLSATFRVLIRIAT
jgi:hypothetical protein